jgi:hypothetical protein
MEEVTFSNPQQTIDAYLIYEQEDIPKVQFFTGKFNEYSIIYFFAETHILPGDKIQEITEDKLRCSGAAVIFLGDADFSNENIELVSISKFLKSNKRSFRIIPIFLPGARASRQTLGNLRLDMYSPIDFSAGLDDEIKIKKLIEGIMGEALSKENVNAWGNRFSISAESLDVLNFIGKQTSNDILFEALISYIVRKYRGKSPKEFKPIIQTLLDINFIYMEQEKVNISDRGERYLRDRIGGYHD